MSKEELQYLQEITMQFLIDDNDCRSDLQLTSCRQLETKIVNRETNCKNEESINQWINVIHACDFPSPKRQDYIKKIKPPFSSHKVVMTEGRRI